ncbi:hypothetical protein [Mycoplasma bradburyae]|uniref:Uncharacterized protein n=1 Tax=Mycoplasma bradburyae TaxID=2963128 RepID=A0AAW6HS33_9MOLU|nr:hypothetical protein [Mycoplasma bradburyae]MDC4183344.1 hypothetical protein [Mycoplasma bradburyae]UTS71118.1 hypothetical protein NMG77_01490 [Mycoplasma bradburyae]
MKLFKKVFFGATLFGLGIASMMSGLYYYQKDKALDLFNIRQNDETISEVGGLNGYDPLKPNEFLKSNIAFNNHTFSTEKQAASYFLSVANNFVTRKLMIGDGIKKDPSTGEIINADGLKDINDSSFRPHKYRPAYLLQDNKYTSDQTKASLERIGKPEHYIKSPNGLIYGENEAVEDPTPNIVSDDLIEKTMDDKLDKFFKDLYYYEFEDVTKDKPTKININPLNLIDILKVKNLAIDSLNLNNTNFNLKLYELNEDHTQYNKVDNAILLNKMFISNLSNKLFSVINNFLWNNLFINIKGTVNNNNKDFRVWFGVPYLSISKSASVEYELPFYLRSSTENVNKFGSFNNLDQFIDSVQSFTDPVIFRDRFLKSNPVYTAFNKIIADNYIENSDKGLFGGYKNSKINAIVHGDQGGIGWSTQIDYNNNVGIYVNPTAKFVNMSISLNINQNKINSYQVSEENITKFRNELNAAIPSSTNSQKMVLIDRIIDASIRVLTKKIFEGFDINSNTSRDDIRTYMSSVIANQLNIEFTSALTQSNEAVNIDTGAALQNLIGNLFSLNDTLNSRDKMFVIEYNDQPLFGLNILSDDNFKNIFLKRYSNELSKTAIDTLADSLKEYKKIYPNRVNSLLTNVSNTISYNPTYKKITLKPLNDDNLLVKYNVTNFDIQNLYSQFGITPTPGHKATLLNNPDDKSNSDVEPYGIIQALNNTLFSSNDNVNNKHLVNVYDVLIAWNKDGSIKPTKLAKAFNLTINPSVTNSKIIKYRSEVKPELVNVIQESKNILVLRNWLGDIVYEETYQNDQWPTEQELKNITSTATSTLTIDPSTRFLYDNGKLVRINNLHLIYEIRLGNVTRTFDKYEDAFSYIWRVIRVSSTKINNLSN